MRRLAFVAVLALALLVVLLPACAPGPETCTKNVPQGSSFSQAMSGVSSGDVVCLSGLYNWGDYNPPAGVTILAPQGSSATIAGEARVTNPNTSLINLTLAALGSENHAVLTVEDNDFVGQFLDINTQRVGNVQGVIVGGGGSQPNNTWLIDSKIHGARPVAGSTCFAGSGSPLTGSQVHAIYWASGTGGVIARNWLYDYSGYGLHIFGSGSVNGTAVLQVVSDSRSSCASSLGNVKDSVSGTITVNKSITQNGNWRCLNGGVTISNSRMSGGFQGSCTDAGGNATGVNTTFNSSTDLRVPGDPDFQFVAGPQ